MRFYGLQSLFISMKICIVGTDVIMTLPVPAERVTLHVVTTLIMTWQGFFSQSNLGDFFPNFENNSNLQKTFFFFFFFFRFIFSHNTHTSYMVTSYFYFNLMAKVLGVITNLFFLLTKNDIIVHYNKFPNLGVYDANFPNLKGPGAPSQNCKKNPCMMLHEFYLSYMSPGTALTPLNRM